jgi:ProP effector
MVNNPKTLAGLIKTNPLATIQLLARTFPAAFFVLEQRRRPLKIGIRADLVARLEGVVSEVELSTALRVYTSNLAYLRSCHQDTARLDLDGQPSGTVSAERAARAAKLVARRVAAAKANAPAGGKTPPTEAQATPTNGASGLPTRPSQAESADTTAPKRLGLAGLKAAWQARQAAKEAAE